MANVRDYVRRAIERVYRHETPEVLGKKGIDVVEAEARFLDAWTVAAGDRVIRGKHFLISTGARPVVPDIPGLGDVNCLTYENIWANDHLPERLVVIGGGPIGIELTQAYGRLGSRVTVVASRLLPREEPEVQPLIRRVLGNEGARFLSGRATSVSQRNGAVVVGTRDGEAVGDALLVAVGRTPTVSRLDLARAGVESSQAGIPVDEYLRTNVQHILAAGDVLGGAQFTHLAGWQAFQAVRNALLPGKSRGFSKLVPRVTFTDPEVAQLGQTEAEARDQFGSQVEASHRELDRLDRAVCEGDDHGFVKIVHRRDGRLLGATVVAARAGEMIAELGLAIHKRLRMSDLAGVIHAYPTYSTGVQQLGADVAIRQFVESRSGRLLRSIAGLGGPRQEMRSRA